MYQTDTKALREELAQALRRKFDDSHGIAVYGAGDTAEHWFASFLEGDVVPTCFIDDTPGKAGTLFCGKPVITLKEAQETCKSFLILLCSFLPETREKMAASLEKSPIENAEICMEWEEYIFSKHAEEVLAVFDMLEDPVSKATYSNMIQARMGKAEQDQTLVCGQQYFAVSEFAKLNIDEVFVDCGAYVGDTLEQYLMAHSGMFKKVYAFEPMDELYRAMQCRVERLKNEWAVSGDRIQLIQAGVGERSYQTEVKHYEKGGVMTNGRALSGESAHGDIPVISIDDYFAEQPITFLKADIEGYEWKMLHGAEKTIKRDRPKLAICIYHMPFDMYRIALWIKSVCPDYKFAVRQHYCDIWETVLYAYI
ncbi:FkbM family methyltransferase [Oscillospiraceae bacterium 38-13]